MTTTQKSPEGSDSSAGESGQAARGLVEEFFRRQQAGEQPDPFALILAHPNIASELESLLAEAIAGYLAAQSHPFAVPVTLHLSRELGRYRIERLLGSGSSAVVYLAYDTKFERHVALKVSHGHRSGTSGSAGRFDRDARILARLRHAHIVQLHETGEWDHLQYIDMEFVDGPSLEQRLGPQPPPDQPPSRPLPLDCRAAVELVRQVAEALQHAHAAGVIHRDVKPSNILLDAASNAQLTDFDLACRVGVDESLTLQGALLGTPEYMSPELATGKAHQADARSDVYSLGVVLYRLLLGRVPFQLDKSVPELLRRIETEEPEPPRQGRPEVPRDLETICLKALEKRPEDRFQTAGAFAEELWRWMHDEPLTVRRLTFAEWAWRRIRRQHWIVRWLMLATAGLLAVCSVLGLLLWEQRQRAAVATAAADLARERHAFETESRARAEIRSLLDQAWQRLRSPEAGRRLEAQKTLLALATPRRLLTDKKELEELDLEARSLFAMTLALPDLIPKETVKLPASAFYAWPVAFHPDGKTVAIGTAGKPIVWRLGQKPNIPEKMDALGLPPRIAFSPDGRYLTVAPDKGGLHVWDGEGTELLKSPVEPSDGPVLAVCWDDAATTLRAFLANGRLRSWSLPSFAEWPERSVPVTTGRNWTAARFAPTGATLAIGSEAGQVQLYDTTDQKVRTISDVTDRIEVQALAWSADASLLAVGSKGGRIQLRRADGTKVREFRRSMEVVTWIDFSSDNTWLVAGGVGGGTNVWDLETGELLLTSLGVCGAVSSDGRSLVSGSQNEVRLQPFLHPTAIRVFRGHGDGIEQIAWSADGRRLATLDAAFDVRVWDVEQNSLVDRYSAPVGGFFAQNAAIALNPDGSLLAYVSSGERKSRAVMRDVAANANLDTWDLSGGYDFLAATGPDQFLLVREELEPGKETVRTVAQVLRPHHPASPPRLIRPSETGDQRRFLKGQLTPDGRYYCWVGPRKPPSAQRVEIWAVDPARRIAVLPTPQRAESETRVYLDPSARYLWVQDMRDLRRYDLVAHDPPTRFTAMVFVTALIRPGVTFQIQGAPPWHGSESVLVADLAEGKRLRWAGYDESPSNQHAFSRQGNRLAWGTRSGLLFVADLDALTREVDAFEASLRSTP